jgi:ribonucleoside-triphosphate reductase
MRRSTMTVIKRDGKKVEFDVKKIERVINLANKSVPPEKRIDVETVTEITNKVVQKIGKRDEVEVEEIQDIVEQNLLQNKKAYFIGKEFLRVRDERTKERFKRLDITRRIKEKLDASNVQNQNANLDEHSFGGRKGEAESELLKQMALDYYISPKFAKNHINNRVYLHDLDSYVLGCHNCLSVPIDELLANGFNTRQVDIRPAGSVNTAMQLLAVIFQLQSLQQFGGVAATHVDWSMVPYVRKSFWKHFKDGLKYVEGLSDDEIKNFEKELKGDVKE